MHSFRKHALTVALGLALTAGSAFAVAAPVSQTAAIAHATALQSGDMITGALPMSHSLHVTVALNLRNEPQLDAAIAQHHVMSQQQFMADHAPTAAQAQAVADFLSHSGFHNVTIAPNRLLVSGDAPAGLVQRAFNTQMVSVHTHDGRAAFANSSDIVVPASLHGSVKAVLGLQTVHVPHVFKGKPGGGGGGGSSIIGHDPMEFGTLYGGSGLPTGSGVSVGIITNGDLSATLSDLNQFTSSHGLAAVSTQIVNTDGTGTDTSGTAEWDLDSQDILGMAGGQIGKIVFYNIPTLANSSMVDDFNTAVSANAVKVINVSLGECETSAKGDGSAAAADNIFKQAVAQGQTFSVSTGDAGSNECGGSPRGTTPSWPASSPYVVAVGGTTLNATTTTWQGETVWADTGGSPSTFEPMPSWQVGVGQNAGHTTRGLPDIAFDADPNSGSKIIVNGSLAQYGGTSLSSPLFVGFWARMIAAKGTGIGFAAPKLYALPSTAFHDVVSGSNGGEKAAPGWDYTTGFGSIIMNKASTSL
ncbi:MAG TPA: S53 family peptidase [Rhodanobacteraceae bacterium]|jgi:xanthomonalisin|nr:S53 family peptidase [Rhodanobacteraceae bacterium]